MQLPHSPRGPQTSYIDFIDVDTLSGKILMNIVKGLKAAAKAFVSTPRGQSFHAAGKQVVCMHCENILFHKQKASLNRALSSLAGTEWLDKEACILTCANCSRLEWFYDDLKADESS